MHVRLQKIRMFSATPPWIAKTISRLASVSSAQPDMVLNELLVMVQAQLEDTPAASPD